MSHQAPIDRIRKYRAAAKKWEESYKKKEPASKDEEDNFSKTPTILDLAVEDPSMGYNDRIYGSGKWDRRYFPMDDPEDKT